MSDRVVDEELVERVAKALAETEFSETKDFDWEDMPDESSFLVSRNDFRRWALRVCYPTHFDAISYGEPVPLSISCSSQAASIGCRKLLNPPGQYLITIYLTSLSKPPMTLSA